MTLLPGRRLRAEIVETGFGFMWFWWNFLLNCDIFWKFYESLKDCFLKFLLVAFLICFKVFFVTIKEKTIIEQKPVSIFFFVKTTEKGIIIRFESDFKLTLQQQNSLEQWASWLKNVVKSALRPYEGKPNFSKAARQFLLKWSFYRCVFFKHHQ